MTKEERIELFLALSAPFPDHAVERTDGRVTGRGYDTAGIKYQYVVDRFNAVLGVGGFRTVRTTTVKPITTAKGRPGFEAIAEVKLELGEWIDGDFIVFAEAWGDGGHTAMAEADARKGAYTNAFKKAAAFVGPGHEAYLGTIDDDHAPADAPAPVPRTTAPRATSPTARASPATTAPHPDDHDDAAPSRSGTAQPIRSRLTSKQFAALRSLSQRAGYETGQFKDEVRRRYGVEAAYLSSRQASELIGELLSKLNGHGARAAG